MASTDKAAPNNCARAGSPRIEWVPIGTLRSNPRNARTHSKRQVRQIAASIRKFGFLNPVPIANPTRLTVARESGDNQGMGDLCRLIWCFLAGLFRSRASLEAEILVLRHQLNVLRLKSPKRLAFRSTDRLVFAGLYRLAPGVLDALKILKPETVIRWHRAGFRLHRPGSRTGLQLPRCPV
jgi:hypothetical protein